MTPATKAHTTVTIYSRAMSHVPSRAISAALTRKTTAALHQKAGLSTALA